MFGLIAFSLFLVLELTAVLHLYWSFGGVWPGKDDASLEAHVVGTKTGGMPPRLLTFVVSILIAIAGFIPLFWSGFLNPTFIGVELQSWFHFIVKLGMIVLALVFLARGAVTYTPLSKKMGDAEPFHTLNKRYYSPLILAIGVGFTVCLFLK